MRLDASHSPPAGCGRPDRPWQVLVFGVVLAIAGILELALAVNRLSSVLALATMASYLLVYTPLKRKTPLCTLIGAIPGAAPPLIGWAGATGALERRGLDPVLDGLFVAVSTFHGDRLDVPRGLPPSGVSSRSSRPTDCAVRPLSDDDPASRARAAQSDAGVFLVERAWCTWLRRWCSAQVSFTGPINLPFTNRTRWRGGC